MEKIYPPTFAMSSNCLSSELAAVDQTMLLEDQRVDEDIAGRRVGERADEWLYSRRLWDSLPPAL